MLELVAIAALLSGPPNVVVILADDQSYRDFGFMGNELVHTPNIDRLAAKSAVFANGYVPMSVCRPSLATILTGRYPHQHGVHFNHPPPGLSAMRKMTAGEYHATRATAEHLIGKRQTIPRLLAQHGYVSFQAGKHWEGDYRNAGFTHGMTTGRPVEAEDWVRGTRPQTNGELVAHGNGDAGLAIGRVTMQPVFDFVDQHAGKKPFLLWYAPFMPHTPFDAGPEFHQPYANKNVPYHLKPYYAEIARFDATVGKLLSHIEEAGLTDETLFVFASDNGFRPDEQKPSRQNDRSKLTVGEDGIRTPILVRWDGHTTPNRHDRPVRAVDILPTILDAVGHSHDVPAEVDGISLMPSSIGYTMLVNKAAFGAIYPNDAKRLGDPASHVRGRWIRQENWKLIVPGNGSKPLEAAFYDLANDPLEERNLFTLAEHAEIIAKLGKLLDEWWTPNQTSVATRLKTQDEIKSWSFIQRGKGAERKRVSSPLRTLASLHETVQPRNQE